MGRHSIEYQAEHCIGKEHSLATQTHESHLSALRTIGAWLEERYQLANINNVKSHMVATYFKEAKESGYGASTLEKHATAWRQIASHVGKDNIVPRTNSEIGIGRKVEERFQPVSANINSLNEVREALIERSLTAPDNRYLVVAYDLRQEFGLRAKESLQSHVVVERGGRPFLQIEGTKGGRERHIEIVTDRQREVVATARELCRETGRSIIPTCMSLKQAYALQANFIHRAGGTKANGSNMHSQRHDDLQRHHAQRVEHHRENGLNASDAVAVADKETTERAGHGRDDAVDHYVEKK
jgi:hypothetical protein